VVLFMRVAKLCRLTPRFWRQNGMVETPLEEKDLGMGYMIENSDRFILRIKNLSKKFGGIVVIDDLDFNFREGEIRALSVLTEQAKQLYSI